MSIRVAYLCLQATRQGQASFAHVHEIIAGLREAGVHVELFEPGYATAATSPGVPARLLEFGRVIRRLRTQLHDFDVVYVRDHPAAGPAIAAARSAGIPVVLEINGRFDELALSYPWTGPAIPFIRRTFLRRLDAAKRVITVTDDLAAWVRTLDPSAGVTVIPNAANTDLFNPGASRPEGLPARYAVFFGALAPWHGVDTLLAAVDREEWPEDVHLVIAGSPTGASAPAVIARAATDDRVVFLGLVPYADLPGVVAGALAGVSPQNSAEGRYSGGYSPLKVYEMLACGIPVVVSDFPGLADLVRDAQAGAVITPGDTGALASAVRTLASDAEAAREMGARGRAAVQTAHSWTARATDTLAVIEGVLR